jgi:hypothetical protein
VSLHVSPSVPFWEHSTLPERFVSVSLKLTCHHNNLTNFRTNSTCIYSAISSLQSLTGTDRLSIPRPEREQRRLEFFKKPRKIMGEGDAEVVI